MRGFLGTWGGSHRRTASRVRCPRWPSSGRRKDGRTGDLGVEAGDKFCDSHLLRWAAGGGGSLCRCLLRGQLLLLSRVPRSWILLHHVGWGQGSEEERASLCFTHHSACGRESGVGQGLQHGPPVILLSCGDLSGRIRPSSLVSARQCTHTHSVASLTCTCKGSL